jgi:hypothetical protein
MTFSRQEMVPLPTTGRGKPSMPLSSVVVADGAFLLVAGGRVRFGRTRTTGHCRGDKWQARKMASFGHGAIKHAPDAGSPQIKSLLQQRERSRHQFLRLFADLPVKLRVVVGVHPALKCLRSIGSVKEQSRDAQSADPVTSRPSGTNLVSLGLPAVHRRRECPNCR